MRHHPWDDRDLTAICAEEDNGVARSQARRAERERVNEWLWMLVGFVLAVAIFYLATFGTPL